jgi:hypothetical protein
MLLSSSKDLPKSNTISERDLILANALAYVESIEAKIAERRSSLRAQAELDIARAQNDSHLKAPTTSA